MSIRDLIAKKKQKIESEKQSFLRPIKPAPGKNIYRILPSWRKPTEEEIADGMPAPFFQDFAQHFIKQDPDQKKPDSIYICTDKTFGAPCEICEMIDQAYVNTDDENFREVLKASKSKATYLLNVLHINGDKPNEPQIMGVGSGLFLDICEIIDEHGDITDLEDGVDLVINRTGTNIDTSYSVVPRAKNKCTPVNPSVMQNVVNLESYVQQENASRQKVALKAMGKIAGLIPSSGGALAAPSTRDDDDAVIDDAEFEEVASSYDPELDEDVDFQLESNTSKPAEVVSEKPVVDDLDLDELDDLLAG